MYDRNFGSAEELINFTNFTTSKMAAIVGIEAVRANPELVESGLFLLNRKEDLTLGERWLGYYALEPASRTMSAAVHEAIDDLALWLAKFSCDHHGRTRKHEGRRFNDATLGPSQISFPSDILVAPKVRGKRIVARQNEFKNELFPALRFTKRLSTFWSDTEHARMFDPLDQIHVRLVEQARTGDKQYYKSPEFDFEIRQGRPLRERFDAIHVLSSSVDRRPLQKPEAAAELRTLPYKVKRANLLPLMLIASSAALDSKYPSFEIEREIESELLYWEQQRQQSPFID